MQEEFCTYIQLFNMSTIYRYKMVKSESFIFLHYFLSFNTDTFYAWLVLSFVWDEDANFSENTKLIT